MKQSNRIKRLIARQEEYDDMILRAKDPTLEKATTRPGSMNK